MKVFFDLQRFDNIENSTPNKVVTGTAMNDSIKNTAAIVTIQACAGNDTIYNSGNIVKIYGGVGNDFVTNDEAENVTISTAEGDDYVYNFGDKVSISSGNGSDKIYSGDSQEDWGNNATITGGAGDDLIVLYREYDSQNRNNIINYIYGDGNDTISGFRSDDTLYITTSKSFTTTKSGSDMYIIFDNGSITLQNVGEGVGSSNIVTIKGGTGGGGLPTGLTYNIDKTEITASKKFKGSAIDLTKYSKVKNLDASAVTKKLKITGNSLDNEIQGGSKNDTIKGGAGNDTLIGGAGNDILTGGNGADVFVHSAGNDIIKDYKAGEDIIKLQDTTIESWKIKKNDVIFITDNGQITVKNGKGKSITITETKTYSNNIAALFAEDNLSEIVAEKSVGEFEFTTALDTISATVAYAEK